jgi:hypothetical protein
MNENKKKNQIKVSSIPHSLRINFIIYIYIYIELGYGVLQSTKVLCALRSIFNFKSEMIDPNRSI